MNAVLLRDSAQCPDKRLHKAAVIAGSVAFGVVLFSIIMAVALVRLGILRNTSYFLLAPNSDDNRL